jgi:hypothetical protein
MGDGRGERGGGEIDFLAPKLDFGVQIFFFDLLLSSLFLNTSSYCIVEVEQQPTRRQGGWRLIHVPQQRCNNQ